MGDDYLWDGKGEPDPEVQRFERLLLRFRHNRPAPNLRVPIPEAHPSPLRRRWLSWPRLAAAAAIVLLMAGTWIARHSRKVGLQVTPKLNANRNDETVGTKPAWDARRLEGNVKVGPALLGESGRLVVGEWLETDATSRARIDMSEIGEVEVEPSTRLRLIETRSNQHRLALARGTIHAWIWAPPRQFFVETPSAVAVDLGCAYSLTVDRTGAALVRVTRGWVGFELAGRESFIPAGALCATRPGIGPGTPYFADAPDVLRMALDKFDFENVSPEARARLLEAVLAPSRARDAFTLWHLLSRVNDAERGRVYRRMAALVPPPAGVTRAGVLKGDKRMLDLWWDSLGLGDTSWWRLWERTWPQQTK